MELNHEEELSKIADKFVENVTVNPSTTLTISNDNVHVIEYNHEEEEEEHEDEDEDEDFEFSFFGGDLESPVSAEEAFHNGQIRTIFPLFGQNIENSNELSPAPPVKVFVVSSKSDDVAEGPYCAWSSKEESPGETPAPEMNRKSNSTGFSRLWRMKELVARSNSDGKDTFVFLSKVPKEKKKEKNVTSLAGNVKVGETEAKTKGKKKAVTGSVAAYEALYGKKKGGGKSYLPYRQDLVGLFTNVNGLTRNVHPY